MNEFSKDSNNLPDHAGRYGIFGGQYVPETLIPALNELELEYEKIKQDLDFQQNLSNMLQTFVGRPTELYFAQNLTEKLSGAQIYLKREDLAHTGSHKINNALGQGLLAKKNG